MNNISDVQEGNEQSVDKLGDQQIVQSRSYARMLAVAHTL